MASFVKPNRPLTWFITGASSGFGEALSRRVLASGHTLIATFRNPSHNPDLVAEIEKHGNGSKWLVLDVNDQSSDKIIESIEASGQRIDVLVNNAGCAIVGAIEVLTEEEVRAQMETAYFGPLRLTRAVLPYMRKRRYGVIVNISSVAAMEAHDALGAYAGAKAALDGMTRVLSKEIAPFGIRTLTVSPGTFNTNIGNNTVVGKNPLPDDCK